MPEERDRFRAAGFDGFIEKPIDVRSFPAQVAGFIDPRKEPRSSVPVVRPTLLAVDDIPQNLKLLDAILTPHGYRVITASSGAEALDKVASEHPDLLLLDIVMPGMTGYDVCRAVRESEATRMLPIIMVTASGQDEKVNAIEAGADDFIAKPVDAHELLARVKSLLRVKEYHDTITAQAAAAARLEPDARAARGRAG